MNKYSGRWGAGPQTGRRQEQEGATSCFYLNRVPDGTQAEVWETRRQIPFQGEPCPPVSSSVQDQMDLLQSSAQVGQESARPTSSPQVTSRHIT